MKLLNHTTRTAILVGFLLLAVANIANAAGTATYNPTTDRIEYSGTITIEEIYQQVNNPAYLEKQGVNKYITHKDVFSNDKTSEINLSNSEFVFDGYWQILTGGKVIMNSATVYSINGQGLIVAKTGIYADNLRWWETRLGVNGVGGYMGDPATMSITNSSMEGFTFPTSSNRLTPYWPSYISIATADTTQNDIFKNVSFKDVIFNLPPDTFASYNALIDISRSDNVIIDGITLNNINLNMRDNSGGAVIGNWSNGNMAVKNINGQLLNLGNILAEHATVGENNTYSNIIVEGKDIPAGNLLTIGFNRYGHRGSSTGKYIEKLDNITFKNFTKGIQAMTDNGFEINNFLISNTRYGADLGFVWMLNASEMSYADTIDPRILKHGTIENSDIGYSLKGTVYYANDGTPIPASWGAVKVYSEDVKITANDKAIATMWGNRHEFYGLNDTYSGTNYDIYVSNQSFSINLINSIFNPSKTYVSATGSFIKDYRLLTVKVINQANEAVKDAVVKIIPLDNGEVIRADGLTQDTFQTDSNGYTSIAAVDKTNSPAILAWEKTKTAVTASYTYKINVSKGIDSVDSDTIIPGGIFDYRTYANIVTVQLPITSSDTTPPQVILTDPLDNATGLALNKNISVTFNEDIQAASNYKGITLKDKRGTVYAAANTISANTLSIIPANGLLYNNTYTVTIPVGAVKDLAGNNLANDFSFSFSTALQSLVGYWKFDEGSGVTANDSSSNGNVATLTNGPLWVQGNLGKALSFDGIDDYVNIPDNDLLNFGSVNDFTISAWINLVTASVFHGIYATKLEWDSGKVLSFYYTGGMTNRFELRYNYGGGAGYESLTSSSVIPTTGIWHQAIFIKSGNIGYFYYDGFLIGTDNTNYLSTMNTIGGDKRIGKSGGVSQYLFNGSIDEVRIYNRALSASEINTEYLSRDSKPIFSINLDLEAKPIKGNRSLTLSIYQPRGTTSIYTKATTTDSNDDISLDLSGFAYERSNNYDILIALPNYLNKKISNHNLTESITTSQVLKVGDLNNDNQINSLDWSIMQSKWYSADVNNDFNEDGLVNTIDFSWMNKNWLAVGD